MDWLVSSWTLALRAWGAMSLWRASTNSEREKLVVLSVLAVSSPRMRLRDCSRVEVASSMVSIHSSNWAASLILVPGRHRRWSGRGWRP